jgi:hypothetical protein
MANVVTCPSCNRSLRVPDDLVGTRVQCPSCHETFTANVSSAAEDRPSRRPPPRRDEADDDYDRPSRSRNLTPHRGDTIQLLGILSFFLAPHILGPIAWVMGRGDLREMDEGRMDPAGRDATQTGKTCGMIATIIWYSVSMDAFLVWLTIVLIYGACCCATMGAAGAGGGAPPPGRRY